MDREGMYKLKAKVWWDWEQIKKGLGNGGCRRYKEKGSNTTQHNIKQQKPRLNTSLYNAIKRNTTKFNSTHDIP